MRENVNGWMTRRAGARWLIAGLVFLLFSWPMLIGEAGVMDLAFIGGRFLVWGGLVILLLASALAPSNPSNQGDEHV